MTRRRRTYLTSILQENRMHALRASLAHATRCYNSDHCQGTSSRQSRAKTNTSRHKHAFRCSSHTCVTGIVLSLAHFALTAISARICDCEPFHTSYLKQHLLHQTFSSEKLVKLLKIVIAQVDFFFLFPIRAKRNEDWIVMRNEVDPEANV